MTFTKQRCCVRKTRGVKTYARKVGKKTPGVFEQPEIVDDVFRTYRKAV